STRPVRDDGEPPPAAPPTAQEQSAAAKNVPDAPPPDAKSASRVLAYVEGDVVTYREVLQRAGPELAQFADDPDEKQKLEDRALMSILKERMLYRFAVDAGVKASRDEI